MYRPRKKEIKEKVKCNGKLEFGGEAFCSVCKAMNLPPHTWTGQHAIHSAAAHHKGLNHTITVNLTIIGEWKWDKYKDSVDVETGNWIQAEKKSETQQ